MRYPSSKKTKNIWHKQEHLSIFHTNICSLNANTDQMLDLLHDLDYKFDILSLTETWNSEKKCDIFSPIHIDGYKDYYGTAGLSAKGVRYLC